MRDFETEGRSKSNNRQSKADASQTIFVAKGKGGKPQGHKHGG